MEKSVSKSSSSKLKQRFARMLLASSCSTAANVAAATKPPATRLPETVNHGWNDRCKLDQHYWSFPADIRQRRYVAPVVHVSINCRDRRSVEASEPLLPSIGKEDRKWKPGATKRERRKVPFGQRKKSSSFPYSSSSDSLNEDELDLFSSEEEKDEEESRTTLFSSKSFSSDSSEFYHHSKRKNKSTSSKSMKSTRRPPRRHAAHSTTTELRPLVSISPAKANAGGFPVVKRSTDPYGDFRSSMVEMIVERGMSRAQDLEQLLHSYLKLNSSRHHQVILEAFEDICEAMFGK
ncbi:transcription repressor OFP7-like [Zingiber officinale]|uniref:Transcription repressor n=1 Tax=Zingiber officinale TaxID=94328 RepID=A0A8J5FS81_ZINOF|nr:transcription repressor OFP7-like [Zingiber officinale]KAG6484586.1 hypothetical protein ZIOFF_053106 [Zingiber officinale]